MPQIANIFNFKEMKPIFFVDKNPIIFYDKNV